MGNIEKVELSPEKLIDKYGDLIYSISHKMIQDTNIAEEAVQEAWYEIIKSLDTFKGKSKISTWIYTIAYRVIMNHAKNERFYEVNFLRDYFEGEALQISVKINYDKKLWVSEQCDKCITGILHCLNNENRLAYLLRDLGQLSYESIGEIIDKKEVNIRKMVSRSRKKLEKFLNNQCILYNSKRECNCRMKEIIKTVKIKEEYRKVKDLIVEINYYANSEKISTKKNYWKKYIQSCHRFE